MTSVKSGAAAIGYTPLAKILHWFVVAILSGQYIVAWTMPHIGRNTKPDGLINLHFSLGLLILCVLVVRLAWRLTHREPTPIEGLPPWQVLSARLVHYILYVLLVVVPVLGWVNASYRDFDISLFGIVPFPRLVAARASGLAWTGDVHGFLAYYVLLSVACLHIAAAMYHQFVRKDGVLRRMLPSSGQRRLTQNVGELQGSRRHRSAPIPAPDEWAEKCSPR